MFLTNNFEKNRHLFKIDKKIPQRRQTNLQNLQKNLLNRQKKSLKSTKKVLKKSSTFNNRVENRSTYVKC